jgi:hypothetical protein
VPNVAFVGESFIEADMSTRSRLASLLNSFSNVERNGLRDIGLLPELERSTWLAGDWRPGEAALRKGLLEERLSCRPGDGRRSVDKKRDQRRRPLSSQPKIVVKQAIEGALPGIDGPANMMLSTAHNPARVSNQTLAPRKTTGVLCASVGWWRAQRTIRFQDRSRMAALGKGRKFKTGGY